jgi:hypothetical protein
MTSPPPYPSSKPEKVAFKGQNTGLPNGVQQERENAEQEAD